MRDGPCYLCGASRSSHHDDDHGWVAPHVNWDRPTPTPAPPPPPRIDPAELQRRETERYDRIREVAAELAATYFPPQEPTND